MSEWFYCVLTILIMLIGIVFFNYFKCEGQSVSFSDHKYGVFTGCMVKHNGKWLPLENIRGFDDKG